MNIASIKKYQSKVLTILLLTLVFPVLAVNISVDTAITATDFSYDNQNIVVDGVVLTVDGSHTFLDVELINGAILTHTQGLTGSELNMVNLTIDANSKIDLNGKGMPKTVELTGVSGGSHAGFGIVNSTSHATNSIYGDLRQPVNLGSGGASLLGGGAIKLVISGTLDLAGGITADGENRVVSWGDGSGGSVWIDVDTITGNGEVSADGGLFTNTPGGGGRVAIYYNNAAGFDLTTQVTAFGGLEDNDNNKKSAAAGTVYLKDKNLALGEIRIVNQLTSNENIAISELSLPNSGAIAEPLSIINAKLDLKSDIINLSKIHAENSEILQNGNLTIDELSVLSGSHWDQKGQLTVNVLYRIENSSIDHQSAFNIPQANPFVIENGAKEILNTLHPSWTDIEILNSSSLTVNVALPQLNTMIIDAGLLELNVAQDLATMSIVNAGILTHGEGVSGSMLNLMNLTIDSGSKIDISGKGLPKSTEIFGLSGGSHAGTGILNNINSDTTNANYGDIREPLDLGTGGHGLRGGGAIKLVASGTLDISGRIIADGENRTVAWGDGSGGSVWIDANVLTGNGNISADGGGLTRTPGGGGRVAIYYNAINGFDVQANVSAFGGLHNNDNTKKLAGAGSIYIKDKNQALGEIIIVNKTTSHETKGHIPISYTANYINGDHLVIQNAIVDLNDTDSSENVVILGGRVNQNAEFTTQQLAGKNFIWQQSAQLNVPNNILVVNGWDYLPDFTQNWSELILQNNAKIIQNAAETIDDIIEVEVTQLFIDESSSIELNGSGLQKLDGTTGIFGGSYGGLGGVASGGVTNPVYGNEFMPVDVGVGGNWSVSRGGGGIKLSAQFIDLSGEIRANALQSNVNSGHGSGGSVWLTAGALVGNGSIQANGGGSESQSGTGGSGGRVAVYYGVNQGSNLSLRTQAKGGISNIGIPGSDGTVHIEQQLNSVQVVNVSPTKTNQAIDRIRVYFDQDVNVIDFSANDVQLTSATGAVSIDSIIKINDGVFDIVLDSVLSEGDYQLSITSGFLDQNNNNITSEGGVDHFTQQIFVDLTAPAAPVLFDTMIVPSHNLINTSQLKIRGTRDPETQLLINGELYVPLGDNDWSVILALPPGVSLWDFALQDAAGNVSDNVSVIYFFAGTEPAVVSMTPQDEACLDSPPGNIQLSLYDYVGQGFDVLSSQFSVTDDSGQITGSSSIVNDIYSFTPSSPLTDGHYNVTAHVVDFEGNSSQPFSASFWIDQINPAAPNIDPVSTPTSSSFQVLSGTKEANTSIWINDSEVVGLNASTDWSAEVFLSEGINNFTIKTKDCAGNDSLGVTESIEFNNSVPGPVSLVVNVDPGGREATLDWQSYDEMANGGNIDFYTIYQSFMDFTDVSQASIVDTVSAGTKDYMIAGVAPGQTIYYAVVATDITGLSDTSVMATQASFIDTVPPEKPTFVLVDESYADKVDVRWGHSANAAGDLLNYKLYLDDIFVANVDKAINTYTFMPLSPATKYTVKVTSIDDQGIESLATSRDIYTWLPNPVNIQTQAFAQRVSLTWDDIPQATMPHSYRIYYSPINATDVANMTYVRSATTTNAEVTGLDNNTEYYFAVTTANAHGDFDSMVTTVSATPIEDSEGPTITAVQIAGMPITEGMTITHPGEITLSATDDSGMASTSFTSSSNVLNVLDGNGSLNYRAYWDIQNESDGPIQLNITATDAFNNETSLQFNLNISLAAPAPPIITAPANGSVTAELQTTVVGTTDLGETIEIMINGQPQISTVINGSSQFQSAISLQNGSNVITARALNNRGVAGDYSAPITVEVNQQVPITPVGLTAQARADGVIRLSWNPDTEGTTVGYNVYRATSAFENLGTALKINNQLVTGTFFDDLAIPDAEYFYRIEGVSETGIKGQASNMAAALSDSIAPSASIVYTPNGEYDSVNGIYGVGRVDVDITFSEELLTTPFVSISPTSGVPIAVILNQISATEYSGYFELGNQQLEATAYAVLSAYDKANNRGTTVTEGATIVIDTLGPVMTSLSVLPESPIQYSVGDAITVDFELNDDAVSTPQLFYTLSNPGRQQTEVINLIETSPKHWQATFTLPDDVGLNEAETLSFSYSALDQLNNEVPAIALENQFQIYQGNLPPLNAPFGVDAQSRPMGHIQLSWFAVEGAVEYEILRKHESEQHLIAIARTVGNVAEYTDIPPADGHYVYAIASVRQENAQQAVSGPSQEVTVYSDSIAPNAPTNMSLVLQGSGIVATWDESVQQHPGDDDLHYNLYRSDIDPITDVSALTPVFENLAQNGAIDNMPSTIDHAYVATAIDPAGNESAPSNTFYLNFELLPVNNLTIDLYPDHDPIISWSHTSNNISQYDVFVEGNGNLLKLNQATITTTAYTDTTYAGEPTTYSVVAIDDQGQNSIPHHLKLPLITSTLQDNQSLKRGLMNELTFEVNNFENMDFENVSISVGINGESYTSNKILLAAGATQEVSLVIPGDSSLKDTENISVVTHYQPTSGESANIHSTAVVNVIDGGLILNVTTDNFQRGTNGLVQIMVQNPGEKSIDIITSENSGDSTEIHLRLEDADGNVLNGIQFKQILGEDVFTLPNGKTIARIEAGSSFLSAPQEMAIPANAADRLFVVATIDKVYHQYGQPLQRQLQGIANRQEITIAETSYSGELSTISPVSVIDEGQINITGRAISRTDGSAVANVPLKVILRVDGFERVIDVYTDETGTFTHVYTPSSTDAGIYQVSVVHPDILDRPIEGTFQVSKLNVSHSLDQVKLPYNVARNQTVYVKVPRTLEFTGVTLGYESSDQPGGSFLPGIQISNIETIDRLIHQDGWQAINFDVAADNSTPVSGTIVLRVLTAETGNLIPAQFSFDYQLSTSEPSFEANPQYIETGVNQGSYVTENITLTNQGFSDALSVNISLLNYENDATAPNWAALLSENNHAQLAVGGTLEISTSFSPPELVADGNYLFKLRITAANAETLDVPIQVTVTHAGVGSILFKTADIYTGSFDENNQQVPGLAGATIKLISDVVIGQEYIGVSNEFGDYLFENIPVGNYLYRVSKSDHEDLSGRVRIKPSVTEYEYAYLTQNFINVEWSVSETSIIDRYEVVMNLTYETNVPASIIVVNPLVTNLPDMCAGDVYSGVLEVTNVGLVRADNFEIVLPEPDFYFEYQLLAEPPATLDAQETIYMPFRIINHHSLAPDLIGCTDPGNGGSDNGGSDSGGGDNGGGDNGGGDNGGSDNGGGDNGGGDNGGGDNGGGDNGGGDNGGGDNGGGDNGGGDNGGGDNGGGDNGGDDNGFNTDCINYGGSISFRGNHMCPDGVRRASITSFSSFSYKAGICETGNGVGYTNDNDQDCRPGNPRCDGGFVPQCSGGYGNCGGSGDGGCLPSCEGEECCDEESGGSGGPTISIGLN